MWEGQNPQRTGHWNADFLPLLTMKEWVNGATFFSIDRQLARYTHPGFRPPPVFSRACGFSRGCYPEQHYVQTMLDLLNRGDKIINRYCLCHSTIHRRSQYCSRVTVLFICHSIVNVSQYWSCATVLFSASEYFHMFSTERHITH